MKMKRMINGLFFNYMGIPGGSHIMRLILLYALFLFSSAANAFGAVGCDLNDPDRDVTRLFPESTGYKTNYISILQKGGEPLFTKIEQRLGDKFQGLFETIDVPYTVYEVFKDKEKTGYIHGVNQKGQYGGIQVFLVLDLGGVIKNFYLQKVTSKFGKQLRAPEFGKQFTGLTLKDFYGYDIITSKSSGQSGVSKIKNPEAEAVTDFRAALRAAKKNLILMDEFVFQNKYLPFFTPSGG